MSDVSDTFRVAPLEFVTVEAPPYRAEYAIRPSNETVFHFFADHHFDDDFDSRLQRVFRESWAPDAGFEITWEPELKSYCVIMRHGFVNKPSPDHFRKFLEKLLKE